MTEKKRDFFGRYKELKMLNELKHSRAASLVVIKGRRRIGKSRLVEEFSHSIESLNFLGLAPQSGVTAQDQRRHFASQLEKQLGVKGIRADDWDDLFSHLSLMIKNKAILIVFDEINWMGSKDPSFLPKLKTAWDTIFSKNPSLVLILSGSMSSWIEKNILSGTGFFGRVSLEMTLEELPLNQCALFWGSHSQLVSAFEKFKVLSVTGGVPRYLEMIRPDLSAEENIERLCFRREGILFNEFDRIFSDLFSRRAGTYKEIVEQLVHGSMATEDILRGVGQNSISGVYTEYLEDLVQTGYLARDYTWHIKTGKQSKLSRYRLRDNYLRFYLRYIEPKKEAILRSGSVKSLSWYSMMGLQFENLLINNRSLLYEALQVDPETIEYDNPFFQTATKSRAGCQVDFLIQTKFNTLYLCEIKFSRKEIGPSVIEEVKEKIETLVLPKGFSIRPVLIHVNGVTDAVLERGFFSSIVDFSDFIGEHLKGPTN